MIVALSKIDNDAILASITRLIIDINLPLPVLPNLKEIITEHQIYDIPSIQKLSCCKFEPSIPVKLISLKIKPNFLTKPNNSPLLIDPTILEHLEFNANLVTIPNIHLMTKLKTLVIHQPKEELVINSNLIKFHGYIGGNLPPTVTDLSYVINDSVNLVLNVEKLILDIRSANVVISGEFVKDFTIMGDAYFDDLHFPNVKNLTLYDSNCEPTWCPHAMRDEIKVNYSILDSLRIYGGGHFNFPQLTINKLWINNGSIKSKNNEFYASGCFSPPITLLKLTYKIMSDELVLDLPFLDELDCENVSKLVLKTPLLRILNVCNVDMISGFVKLESVSILGCSTFDGVWANYVNILNGNSYDLVLPYGYSSLKVACICETSWITDDVKTLFLSRNYGYQLFRNKIIAKNLKSLVSFHPNVLDFIDVSCDCQVFINGEMTEMVIS